MAENPSAPTRWQRPSRLPGVALVFSALLLPAKAAQAAEAPIGELTLAYREAEWRVEGAEGRFKLLCLAESCGRAAFDVTVEARPDGHCDKEEVRLGAEAAFPFADRHPVNIYAVGELALVMAQSRDGPDLSVPTAVLACITRGGKIYRFTSGAGVPYPRDTGSVMLRLALALTPPPPRTQEIRIGAIRLSAGDDRWDPLVINPGKGAMLECLPPTCSDWGLHVGASVADEEIDCFSEQAEDRLGLGFYRQIEERVVGEPGRTLTFRIGTFGTMCRNWTPPLVVACAVHGGRTYRLSTPRPTGCQSEPEVPEDAFMALLASVKLAP